MESNFRWRQSGSSLPGLRTLDSPLRPPLTPAEIFWRTCLEGGGQNPMQKSEPYDNSFWEKSNPGGRKKERRKRKKTLLIVDT